MIKKLLLGSLITLSTLLADAQSVNFLGESKRVTKKELKEYGFDIEVKRKVFSRVTAISAYNEDAGAYGLYIFQKKVCTNIIYAEHDKDQYDWMDVLEEAGYTNLGLYTYIDILHKQIYEIYKDDTLEAWAVYITSY